MRKKMGETCVEPDDAAGDVAHEAYADCKKKTWLADTLSLVATWGAVGIGAATFIYNVSQRNFSPIAILSPFVAAGAFYVMVKVVQCYANGSDNVLKCLLGDLFDALIPKVIKDAVDAVEDVYTDPGLASLPVELKNDVKAPPVYAGVKAILGDPRDVLAPDNATYCAEDRYKDTPSCAPYRKRVEAQCKAAPGMKWDDKTGCHFIDPKLEAGLESGLGKLKTDPLGFLGGLFGGKTTTKQPPAEDLRITCDVERDKDSAVCKDYWKRMLTGSDDLSSACSEERFKDNAVCIEYRHNMSAAENQKQLALASVEAANLHTIEACKATRGMAWDYEMKRCDFTV